MSKFKTLVRTGPISLSTVPGFFQQDELNTDDFSFNPLKQKFGLLKESWLALVQSIEELQKSADNDVRYKLLFLARHGQGYHNLADLIYGTEKWESDLVTKNGDGKIVWGPDPELTDHGISQAKAYNLAWKKELESGAPFPQKFYVSPFTRSIETMQHTWSDIQPYSDHNPEVQEIIRERNGLHTCDKRRTKRYLESRFPNLTFEDGFEDEDTLWREDIREEFDTHVDRVRYFIECLFEKDWTSETPAQFISVTSHSGTMQAFFKAIGHRPYFPKTGEMVPVLIKAQRRE